MWGGTGVRYRPVLLQITNSRELSFFREMVTVSWKNGFSLDFLYVGVGFTISADQTRLFWWCI